MYRADLSRRVGPAFADAAVDAALDTEDTHGYPAGWGTSPRPVQANPQMVAIKVPAKAYKPAHGGYPGTPVLRNPQPSC